MRTVELILRGIYQYLKAAWALEVNFISKRIYPTRIIFLLNLNVINNSVICIFNLNKQLDNGKLWRKLILFIYQYNSILRDIL